RGERRERLEHVRGLATRHRLHVVVHPEVVVAELLSQLRELLGAFPRARGVPTGVLELPTLQGERAVPQLGCGHARSMPLKSHHWISIIMGRRYRIYMLVMASIPW